MRKSAYVGVYQLFILGMFSRTVVPTSPINHTAKLKINQLNTLFVALLQRKSNGIAQ